MLWFKRWIRARSRMGRVLTQAMSSLRRFAGALRVDLSPPRSYRWQIVLPAVFGTLLSTMVVGDLFFLSLSKAAAASKAELPACTPRGGMIPLQALDAVNAVALSVPDNSTG